MPGFKFWQRHGPQRFNRIHAGQIIFAGEVRWQCERCGAKCGYGGVIPMYCVSTNEAVPAIHPAKEVVPLG